MVLGEIIRKKRKQLNLTLDDISREVGFSKPYISTIETGKAKYPPSKNLLLRLEQILKFDKDYLVHLAYIETMPSDMRKKFQAAQIENQKLKDLVRQIIYQKSQGSQIQDILKTAEIALQTNQNQPVMSDLIPVINKVAAGYPQDFNDLDYPVGIADEYVRCPDINDANSFAVCVIGDSMEPKYHQGDIVVFSPRMEVRNGDDCFVRFKDPHETTFKRVYFESGGKIRLQPRNDKYSPIITTSERLNGIYKAIRTIQKI
jgi:phage repressor protein C with HTH and peptisase S24 domain